MALPNHIHSHYSVSSRAVFFAARSVYIGKSRDTHMRKGSKVSCFVGKLERLWLTKNSASPQHRCCSGIMGIMKM